jgi:carboxyl-terminal processing protease
LDSVEGGERAESGGKKEGADGEEEKPDGGYTSMAVFARALQLIRQDYVDSGRAGYRRLTHAALRGMLASLDPHSQFMDPEDFKGLQEDANSHFGGLGIQVVQREGELVIVGVTEGGAGAKAGLMPSDRILRVDGRLTDRLDFQEVTRLLRGEVGKKVALTILRPEGGVKEFEIVRENISVASVRDARFLEELGAGYRVGYVRITQFNVPTAEELGGHLDALEKQGLQALVLDLRFNPGGLLDSAVKVAGQFLPPKTLVVSTEGRVSSQSRVYRTPERGGGRRRYPIAILINNGSASGSEIVAGALKDLNRAVLVGETTFGKGSVQSVIELQDGSALRLTTAKYYTPSKQVIHERGVAPHVRAVFSAEQERLLLLQRREETLTAEEREELKGFKDTQLERAVSALRGVLIYAERTGKEPWLK